MITILLYHLIVLTQLYLVCRNKTVNIKEMTQVFLVGATAAVLGNFLIQGIAVRIFGSDFVYYTFGPIAEEVIKVSFVVFLLFKTRMGKSVGIEDGLLLGAAVGAGYGFSEDAVRAIGLGFSQMIQYFPGYGFNNFGHLLTTWLPTERGDSGISSYNIFVAGHLLWTALAGLGFALALKISSRFKGRYLIALGLLVWVIVDHSLANNPGSGLRIIHGWYGYGLGIKYALTVLLIGGLIFDELILKRNLALDGQLLLPGEKKRSIFGELWLSLTGWRFGKKYWLEAMDYFNLRRRLGFMAYAKEENGDFLEFLKKRRRLVIASAGLEGKYKNPGLPPGIALLWQGPQFNFFRSSFQQKAWWAFIMVMLAIGIFNAWFFFFSVYFPESFVRGIYKSPLLPILGTIGYAVALFEIFIYYRKKLWQKEGEENDDRVKQYSHPIFINTSGITIIFSLPFFTGQHPLLMDKFLWGQLQRFFEFLKESRKWIGGPVSAGIGMIPIVGNVQSGANAYFGYDYIADEPVEGFDRFMAALGAVPIAGNVVRSGWLAAKSARYVKLGKVVNSLKKPIAAVEEFGDKLGDAMDKIEKVQTARDYLNEAYGKVRDEFTEMTQTQAQQLFAKRDQMFKDWSSQGGLKRIDEGQYQMPYEGNQVNVYTGKAGTAKLELGHHLPETGQVSVDSKNQSVMFDTIGKGSPAESQSQIAALQKKFPEYTVLHRQTQADGFSVTDVVAPDGTGSSFYSVPTHSRGNVSAVSSR